MLTVARSAAATVLTTKTAAASSSSSSTSGPFLRCLAACPQICCHASLAPGDDPTFMAQQPAAASLTPEVAQQLIELLKASAQTMYWLLVQCVL